MIAWLTTLKSTVRSTSCVVSCAAALLLAAGCQPTPARVPAAVSTHSPGPAPTSSVRETPSSIPSARPVPLVPDFGHIVIIVLENKEFGVVVGNPQMPYFNALAASYTLLTAHYAVTHPSLPNYLAMISGETFGLDYNCDDCLFQALTLPDTIEASGRTWKTYQEDMPSSCYDRPYYNSYAVKHNPFMYFESIRLDQDRCMESVVPFTQLYTDIAAHDVPDYVFITPNLCNDAHDCGLGVADEWLHNLMLDLQAALEAKGEPYLIVVTWDEGQGNHSCCGLPEEAGGRIATVLVSPQARMGFQDDTPYTHYSVLKTVAEAWKLPYLGQAAEPVNALITRPWRSHP